MIQVLLPALVAIAASRAARNNSGTQEWSSPAKRIVVWKLFACMSWLVGLLWLSATFDVNRWARQVMVWMPVPYLFPTFLMGPLVVWLGMPRLAYWTMRCCTPLHYAGRQYVGAMLYATLSATRMREPATACARLYERFRGKPVDGVIGQTILGHLAAAQGDRVTAQCVFESIDARPSPPRRSIVRVTARDWLVMDAARRGDWFATVHYATRGGGTSRWSRAVGGMARTFAGLPPHPNWRLLLLWLVAPRRLRLRPLLQRALRAGVWKPESEIAPPHDLPAALTRLAEILTKTAQHSAEVSSAEFIAAVRWVSIRLDSPNMKAQIEHRLTTLDSTLSRSAASVVSAFKSDLVELLLPVVAANPQLVAAHRAHPIIAETLHRLQGKAFESIEMRAKDLATRAEKKHSLDTLSEWQSWAILCDEANRLLVLQPGAKATLFEALWRPLLNYAVFQHNDKKRHTFAQDIFRWLRAHAHGNDKVVEMLDKNIACYQPKD